MSAPKEVHLTVYRGDSARWSYACWHDQARTQPVDLAGVVAAAAVRQYGIPTATPLACTITDNVIDVLLVPATSQALTTDPGKWDLQLTYPSGDVKTIAAGTLTVIADITGAP